MKRGVKTYYGKLITFLSLVFGRKKALNEAVLIFSYPRSGSTWFQNIIAAQPGAVKLFEPFKPDELEVLNRLVVKHRIRLDQEDTEEAFFGYADNIFMARMLNRWMTSHTSLRQVLSSHFTVVKMLRVNHILQHFVKRYPDNKKFILLRHPGAVVSSTLRSNIATAIKEVDLEDRSLICNGQSIRDLVATIEEVYETVTVSWCIEARKLFAHKEDCCLVFYEELALHPDKEVQRIFRYLEKPLPANIQDVVYAKSLTTSPGQDVSKSMSKWQRDLSKEQLSRMQDLLDYFDITFYNMQDVMPIH